MKLYKQLYLVLILILGSFTAIADTKLQDNRIKTYNYNEDEVYLLVIHYGFQSSIEFSNGEEIETLSLGDSYAWKITPVGKRLFIKPLEENIRTNMTIITNKHTYQFDVVSKAEDGEFNKELAYVVRFKYPSQIKAPKNLAENSNDFE